MALLRRGWCRAHTAVWADVMRGVRVKNTVDRGRRPCGRLVRGNRVVTAWKHALKRRFLLNNNLLPLLWLLLRRRSEHAHLCMGRGGHHGKSTRSTTNAEISALRCTKTARRGRPVTMPRAALRCGTTAWQAWPGSEPLPGGEIYFFIWEQHAGNGRRLLRVFRRARLGWESAGVLWWTRLQRRRSPR